METEINEIIKKNLPAHVGDVLKERLEKAEKDAKQVEELLADLAAAQLSIKALNEKVSEYVKFNERNAVMEAREKTLDTVERDLKVIALEVQLTAEKDKAEFAKGVAMGLVRNTEYRKQIMESKNVPCGVDQYGATVYGYTNNDNTEISQAE